MRRAATVSSAAAPSVAQQRTQARELVVLLLRQVPEAEVARALDQLPAGDLQRLTRLLTHAANPSSNSTSRP